MIITIIQIILKETSINKNEQYTNNNGEVIFAINNDNTNYNNESNQH